MKKIFALCLCAVFPSCIYVVDDPAGKPPTTSPHGELGETPPPVDLSAPAPVAPPTTAPPLPAPAPAPNPALLGARMLLSMTPAKAIFLPQEHIPLRITLRNNNAVPVALYEIRKGFMTFTLTDQTTHATTRCSQPMDLPKRILQNRFYSLPAGGQVDKSIYLDGFCKALAPGQYKVELEYRIPYNFDGYSYGYSAFVGSLKAQTQLGVLAPKARANLALQLSRPRRTRADAALPLQVTLRNYGPDTVLVAAPEPPALDLRITRRDGTLVSCRGTLSRLRRQTALLRLAPGQVQTRSVNLAELCDLSAPGDYEVSASWSMAAARPNKRPLRKRALAFEGSVNANRLPFYREAVQARAKVLLELRAPQGPLYQNASIPLLVRARNLGPDIVGLAPPVLGWLEADLYGPQRRRFRCKPRLPGGFAQLRGAARAVRPNTALDAHINLLDLCPALAPGHYRVSISFGLPQTTQTVSGWRLKQIPIWQGRVTAPQLEFDILPAPVAPSPVPAPFFPRPRRPQPANSARLLPPRVSLRGPGRVVRADRPIKMTLWVAAPTAAPYLIANPQPWMVTYTLRDQWGRARSCRVAVSQSGMPDANAYSTLSGGRTLPLSMDLGMACGLRQPGSWTVSAQLYIPPYYDGRQMRRKAWTGTVPAGSVSLRLQQPKDGRGDHHEHRTFQRR